MRSDSDIKRDVESELRWTPDLDATDIAVAVKDGVVQKLQTFQFVENNGQVSSNDDVSLTIRSRSHAAAERCWTPAWRPPRSAD